MDTLNVIEINGRKLNMSSPNSKEFTKQLVESFGDVYVDKDSIFSTVRTKIHNVDGLYFEIESDSTDDFAVEFFDGDKSIYRTFLKSGMYYKLSRKYYTDWKIKMSVDNVVFEPSITFEGKRVFIVVESSSLGDTIAWVPYCEEFRKKHNCHVIVSTFRNDMFRDIYPNLEFVEPGSVVNNLVALYRIGWYYDKDKEPVLPNTVPLQQTATNILGLDYREIHSPIHFVPKERPYSEKYVCIAPNSTAGCKLWNNPDGWVNLTKYLIEKGYKVVKTYERVGR